MSRSSKKGPYLDEKLIKKVAKFDGKTPIKTWARNSEISPEMVGIIFAVHNGKDFVEVRVNEDMIGHHFGEFAPTRKFIRHSGKMQKELDGKSTVAKTPSPAAK